MTLKDRFAANQLPNPVHFQATHPGPGADRLYLDPRLELITAIVDAGLGEIRNIGTVNKDGKYKLFKTQKDNNPLGSVVSISHGWNGRIQFACPHNDEYGLIISISKGYDPKSRKNESRIYDYSGRVAEANALLIDWLVHIDPHYKSEIAAIIARADYKPYQLELSPKHL